MHSLHRAVRTLRQHRGELRLGQDAVARSVAALQEATADRPLRLQFGAGHVAVDGEDVLPFAPGEAPFGSLAAAGVGELLLARGVGGPTLEQLVHLLASATETTDSEHDVAADLRAAELPGVEVHAATRLTDDGPGPGLRQDWWLLPGQPLRSQALQALAERDREANLPALAARLLFHDLDEEVRPDRAALLGGLVSAMLQRGDAASVAWVLERAQQHPSVPAAVAHGLRGRAAAAFLGDWLPTQFGPGVRLQGLVALAMQLGDECLPHLVQAAAAADHPLPGWLLEFLQPGR